MLDIFLRVTIRNKGIRISKILYSINLSTKLIFLNFDGIFKITDYLNLFTKCSADTFSILLAANPYSLLATIRTFLKDLLCIRNDTFVKKILREKKKQDKGSPGRSLCFEVAKVLGSYFPMLILN